MINGMNRSTQELSVARLFSAASYYIPIYQRNYAWGEAEIQQLLRDVMDMALSSSQGFYYIGSLVVWQRPGTEAVFETIDGQQRHTTLALVLAVLRHEFGIHMTAAVRCNLHFDARPASKNSLHQLFEQGAKQPMLEPALRAGYEIARRYLANEKLEKVRILSEYLLDKVIILRTIVPHDTDLNHYFEIMNNRGEQLEKHEVLKARLMGQLEPGPRQTAFAAVWDACAHMNRYVQMGFEPDLRSRIFGSQWDACPSTVGHLFSAWNTEIEAYPTMTLGEIAKSALTNADKKSDAKEEKPDRFASIINFPNFLLHVLRVMRGGHISLDDKALLPIFDQEKPDPAEFMLCMLKCRMLLDRYVIKREHDEEWSLQRLGQADNSARYLNSFGKEDEDGPHGINEQLTMVLSMFHVSFPAQARKRWLAAALDYLFNKNPEPRGADYLCFLENLSDRYFYERMAENLLDDEEDQGPDFSPSGPIHHERLHQGTQVQNFIFNHLDYKLWKEFDKENRGLLNELSKNQIEYIQPRHKAFRFTSRSSVEHYYPQNPSHDGSNEDFPGLSKGVDNFANLCLITVEQNSRLSNRSPAEKRSLYLPDKHGKYRVDSLKQAFMMSYDDWGPSHENNMAHHEKMMLKLLGNNFPAA